MSKPFRFRFLPVHSLFLLISIIGRSSGETDGDRVAGRVAEFERKLDKTLQVPAPGAASKSTASPLSPPTTPQASLHGPSPPSATLSATDGQQPQAGQLLTHTRCQGTDLFYAERMPGAAQVRRGEDVGLPLWEPRENKFLLMSCSYGQASNQEFCFIHHLLLAGNLNRTLVVDLDQQWLQYDWSLLYDLGRLQRCLGLQTVISLAAYQRSRQAERPVADLFLCLDIHTCALPKNLTERLQGLKANVSDFPLWMKMEDLREVLLQPWVDSYSGIVVGDLYDWNSPWEVPSPYLFGDLPFRRRKGCKDALLLAAPPDVFEMAKQHHVARFQGQPYLGVHWRRGDFVSKYCTQAGRLKYPNTRFVCFTPQEFAMCIRRSAASAGLTRILISSNGNSTELDGLQQALSGSQMSFDVAVNPAFPETLVEGGKSEGRVSFDKTILTLSAVFLGTEYSTFSYSVERMRTNLGTASCQDSFLCELQSNMVNQ